MFKKLSLLILSLFFAPQIFAIDIGNISAIRQSTKVKHTENGNYFPLEYISSDKSIELGMYMISIGAKKKNDIVSWEEVAEICSMPKFDLILKSVDFLNPEINLDNSITNLIKEIGSKKETLIKCGLNDILFNIGQEDLLPSSPGLGYKEFTLVSISANFSGRFVRINKKEMSKFRTENFSLKSAHARLNYAENFKKHANKLLGATD